MRIPLWTLLIGAAGLTVGMIGCADSPKTVASTKPARSILDDPMGYKPSFEKPNISGGGIFDYDKKAMEKDLKSVFDP